MYNFMMVDFSKFKSELYLNTTQFDYKNMFLHDS